MSFMENRALFISGIDTDAGKTYATAFLARRMMDEGLTVATQKFIQTGCRDTSEDIEAHRRLVGCAPLPEDAEGITAPIIFSYPASAQLAAAIDGREIDLGLVDASTALLLERYDRVLVEGAGGLMVPIRDDLFTIDYRVAPAAACACHQRAPWLHKPHHIVARSCQSARHRAESSSL